MRWLVGWSSTAAGATHAQTLQPVGAQQLWGDPDPLWAVGDWRADEVRIVEADANTRLAVFGYCGASDDQLRVGLFAARGGAVRHLTTYPGSYTAVVRIGRRIAVATDLAGVRPVFHTPWAGGTAYATAALPLADLVEAQLDVSHLAALLAVPDAPEALGDSTPYAEVRRVPPGHSLILRDGGSRQISSYEPTAPTVVAAPPIPAEEAVEGVREALVDAVRARLAAARHVPDTFGADYGGDHADGRGAHAIPAQSRPVDVRNGPGGQQRTTNGYASDSHVPDGHAPPGTAYDDGSDGAYGNDGAYDSDGAYGNGGRGAYGPSNGSAYGPDRGSAHTNGSAYGNGSAYAHGGAHTNGGAYGPDGGRDAGGRDGGGRDPGPIPGMGPADRRAGRGPAPGVGADLSGGPASATLALLAAGLPGVPGTILGTPGTVAGERLLAVTFNDLTQSGDSEREAELERAHAVAESPRLHHVVVAAAEEGLPYVDLDKVPLTDEPGPALVQAGRHRLRLASGSADQFTGYGARQVLDAHPARLADLLMDRKRRHLLRPATALAVADGASGASLTVPFTVYRAARRLARTTQRDGVTDVAQALRESDFGANATDSALSASLAALSWCRPGPAARWLTGEALAEVSVRLETAAMRAESGIGSRPGVLRAQAALARQAADYRVLEQAAEVRNQRLHAPFLDNQVVRAARELPEAMRVRPGARASVLRDVLAGAGVHELPPGWGTTTYAVHAAAGRAGLRAAIGPLMDLFRAPLLADAGIIEAHVVRKALRSAADGEPLPLEGLDQLVAVELWLTRLMQRRGSCWTGADAPRRRAVVGVPGVPSTPHRPAL
ncbi:asparagine synthase-related protein [Streptomyces sp. XM4193]|uniref:asparagine synthase-related protein n=1 Tax=Streptomyces sp. XM4193 TaxID=2929782 RepID=UPI001FFB8FF5|nr:asparagine synthase-related protein [Streptomyces sp. XM4193]MCK1794447.1 asparagine synthase-related protein [Streptomyces sp. XM4193]